MRTQIGSILLIAALALTFLPARAQASEKDVSDIAALTEAISAASAGDTIVLSQDITITDTITVNKAVTITSLSNVTVTASTEEYSFQLSNGAVLDGLTVQLTGKPSKALNIVGMQGPSTVKNCRFTGLYTLAENDHTSRAIEGAGGELTITGNTFRNLRQPPISTPAPAPFLTTSQMRPGLGDLRRLRLQITGNTFGTNAVDIAIIRNNNDAITTPARSPRSAGTTTAPMCRTSCALR